MAGCIGNAGSGSFSGTGEAEDVGNTYTVMSGDTLWGIARAHGVELQSLIDHNTIPAPYVLRVGQVVRLPGGQPSPAAAALDSTAPILGDSYVVRAGDTFYDISRRSGIPVAALAERNGLVAPYELQVGQVLSMPDVPRDPNLLQAAAPQPQTVPADRAPAQLLPAATARPTTVIGSQTQSAPAAAIQAPGGNALSADPASLEGTSGLGAPAQLGAVPAPTETAVVEETRQTAVVETATGETAVASETQVAVVQDGPSLPLPQAKPERDVALPASAAATETPPASNAALPAPPKRQGRLFDWPVTGKVISRYGPKKGGLHNDGINIAAPAGTPVRAAESGVVAYTGGDLKGFGKLVLIKHQDGYVTAYAHNSQVLVRRGETVRRGDVIARVGETGNVDTPQLHFEIRKEAKPVDPNGLMVSVAGGG